MSSKLRAIAQAQIKEIQSAGTYKRERIITSKQNSQIVSNSQQVYNFCSNNYLGLCAEPRIIKAAKQMLEDRGYGLSSVRFICGTTDIHKQLEDVISKFHGTEDTILFGSCFDANGGFFEAMLSDQDAIISDSLNHASIIDGIRLCKAERQRYEHLDMQQLEQLLKQTQQKRIRMIATDGVFSMDGDFAPLDKITKLAKAFDANIFLDESHSTGFIGKSGRGTPEYFGVQVDVISSTLGKALGGANGGYLTGKKEVIELMRQKARPYLFSNSLPPVVVAASLEVFKMLSSTSELRDRLAANTKQFRQGMQKAGFKIAGHPECPICPVMLGNEKLATEFADEMQQLGIYVIGFSYPVVPKGKARIRVQISAAHTPEMIEKSVQSFIEMGKRKGVIGK